MKEVKNRSKRLFAALADPGTYICSWTKALIDDCWHAGLTCLDFGLDKLSPDEENLVYPRRRRFYDNYADKS